MLQMKRIIGVTRVHISYMSGTVLGAGEAAEMWQVQPSGPDGRSMANDKQLIKQFCYDPCSKEASRVR